MESGFDDAVVPVPDVFSHQRGVGLHGIFVEVVQDEDVDGISGKGAFPAHGQQTAGLTSDIEFLATADHSRIVFSGGFETGGGEYAFIEGGVDQLLDAAVEAAGEGLVVGGEDDSQGGIQPQQIGGQQPGGSGGFSVLRGHGDDQVADFPSGKSIQYPIVGLVEVFEAEGGLDPADEIGESSSGEFSGSLISARPLGRVGPAGVGWLDRLCLRGSGRVE